jgi:murein DD-endopeptidase MepM/ murein hydrolase activator NlpD
MSVDRGASLAHKQKSSRRALWVASIAALPGFGVVAAFGVAPHTLDERLPVNQIVQELTLPALQPLDSALDASFVQEVRVRRGDTVAALLDRLEVDDPTAAKFLQHSKQARILNQLRAGHSVRAETNADGDLTSLSFLTSAGNLFKVERDGDSFTIAEESADLDMLPQMASGEIRSSLFAATDAAGLPEAIATQLAEIFSSQIDFHRDLRRGDRFAVVYETFHHNGELIRAGRVLAAEFTNQGRTFQAVWFKADGTQGGYYTVDGKSLRKSFLRSPLEFSRITSGFSLARFHPILQQWTAHKGIDYGAPAGTRVRTTGDGVVTFAGWQNGGYGNLVIIQHQGKYTTYYAHLSGFAPGIRKGARISQGDFIGYVGQTGMATGPHLHYEFRINDVQHDPLRVALPEAVPITRELRAGFDAGTGPLTHQLGLLRTINVARLD